ncbi:WXG100 family type VII secretion target [Micromonospora olivasterospora]|uniref:Type VII secretion system (Wss) protein ESAT-6 n=1 Tax=Micromonospora olivasterospora TaxID=1880 RepID=A0A562IHZ8_MICOL|nr:WXG100 family type VII secretion target [Micromonospora olivasterospora]TWH70651.1 type VII secretion system (Wss) protein ESAT-6 [Micromonospora olivasterospora]
MANYAINPAGAHTVAEELRRETSDLDRSLENLQQHVNRFTAANNGQAPETYAQAQALWSQGQQEMRQALTVGQARLLEIVQNYVMGDNKGAAIFS